jgi:DNA-binding Lrp family transcriptional regulator
MVELTLEMERILSYLQDENSRYLRIDYDEIAKAETRKRPAERISKERAKEIVKELEEEKIIMGYSALIDAEKIGFITVFIHFDADKPLEKVKDQIDSLAGKGFNITEAFIITGARDIHMKVKVRGLEGYYQLVKEFENIVSLLKSGTGIIGYVKLKEDPRITIE